MNVMNHLALVVCASRQTTHSIQSLIRCNRALLLTCALAAGLLLGGRQALGFSELTWTNGNDVWESPTAWTTNLCAIDVTCAPGGSGGYPLSVNGDIAWFTNAATYAVSLENLLGYNCNSNMVRNASNTVSTVTFSIGTGSQFFFNDLFRVGILRTTAATVYIGSVSNGGDPQNGDGVRGNTVSIGFNGVGTLIHTNGDVDVNGVNVGNGTDGRGTLVVSGPNTVFTFGNNSGGFAVSANSNSFGNSVIVSNGATLKNVASGTFRFGSGAAQCNSSNNTLLVTGGGRLILGTGTITIGNGATINVAGEGAFNNTAIIGNNGTMNCGGNLQTHSLYIGHSKGQLASNNVLRVLTDGYVLNVSQVQVTSNNVLDMAGGVFGGNNLTGGVIQIGGTVTNWGRVQGYGTFMATLTVTNNGVLATSNSVASMVFSNSLNFATGGVVQVELGSTTYPTIVRSNLQIRTGTWNITNSAGFGPGTYTVFTNLCNCDTQLTYEEPSVTNVPDPSFTYQISTNTPGVVKIIVSPSAVAPGADFTGTPTYGQEPLAVTFSDSSTNAPTGDRHWDFGDGTLDTTSTNFVHNFASGVFTVSLTVTNSAGSSSLIRTNYVTVLSQFDWWRSNYFGCVACPQAAATADPDGDGMSNTNEFMAGTSPISSVSALRITSVARQVTNVVVTWSTGGGKTNRVQAASGTANGSYSNNFADISGDIAIPGSGDQSASYTDFSGATNAPSRFYRIRLVP